MRSFALSAAWAPARIAVCVHCGPPVGVEGFGGCGTLEQFGVPLIAACVSRGPVWGPTTPSTATRAADWNQRIAAVVRDPSLPSIEPALHPRALSSRWISSTVAASLVPGL